MNPVRWFRNTPMFTTHAEAAEYLARLQIVGARGYIADDGTIRLMVELDTSDEGSERR